VKDNLTRRRFLQLTAGMLAGSALAACGAAATATPVPPTKAPAAPAAAATTAPTAKPAAATPAAAAATKGEIVTVFHYGQWDDARFGPMAERWSKKYPNITLTGVNSNDDYVFVQKVTTMAAAGTPPDLMQGSVGRYIAVAPTGVFEDLQPRIDKSADMQRIMPGMPGKKIAMKYLGKSYAVIYAQDLCLWVYNKEIFDKAGVAYPTATWTWNDVTTTGQKLVDAKNNVYFVDIGNTSFDSLEDWFWGNGTNIFTDDWKHLNFDQQANIDALVARVGLHTTAKVSPPTELKVGSMGFTFATGKMAMARSGTQGIAVQLGDKPTWNFKWGATLPPAGPKGQVVLNRPNVWFIGKGAKNADLAWQFISWQIDDEEQTVEAKAGFPVVRNDIYAAVTVPTLPAELAAAVKAGSALSREQELSPGWSACQDIYGNEMDAAYLGRITPQQGAANVQAKGQPALDDAMKKAGLA
jgi:multiple sugar transport system substrate-binding protein